MNNQAIKFISVTIRNFRGVPDELFIPLDAPLTVIHAANGTGKSTICYALEWLLTNRIEDLRNTTDFSCQWGRGETSVSATCLVGGELCELTRKGRSVWIAKDGYKRKKIGEAELLKLLTPNSVSGRTSQAIGKAKRGWLRNSRWLYSNSLSLLVDNNKAEERQQIFADILGLGHFINTLRELRDYRKELPSTKGLQDRVNRLDHEIIEAESMLNEVAPLKKKAADYIKKILEEFSQVQSTGKLEEDFKVAQIQVRLFEERVQNILEVIRFLSEQWAQYSTGTSQISTLRKTLDSLLLAREKLSDDHSKLSAELSAAEVKAAEGLRSVKWAKEHLNILSQWKRVTLNSIFEGVSSLDKMSQSQLQQQFVELSWSSEKQEEWLSSVGYLIHNSAIVIDLVRQKQDLITNVVHPPSDIVDITRQVEEAKRAKVKAESEFNALSSVLDKLRAIGWEIVNSHETGSCPLCNHNWGGSDKLRQQITGEKVLNSEISDATRELSRVRRIEQDCQEKLTLANNQKSFYDAYVSRLMEVNDELATIAQRTGYLEIMGVPDFSSFNVQNLSYLQSRIEAAIAIRKIRESLVEVEGIFQIVSAEEVGLRVSAAHESLIRYKDYYQAQEEKANFEKLRLTPLVRGGMENIQAKSREIDGVNSNIAAISQSVGRFETHWKEVAGEEPIILESYNTALGKAESERAQVEKYKAMLAECEAIAKINSDSESLNKLRLEKAEISKKLEAGNKCIAVADRTIERYAQHVRQLTTSSLAPLLSPAAELFSRMHANEVYKDLSVSEGDEALKWTVFAEGHELALDAEEKFSQGQRQDLALSLYLARARNTGGTFFLDEPIAHLDDLNRVAMLDIFRLVATSMPNMNLVLTTASDALARHMAQKFSSITDRHILSTIQLEGNPRTGVTASITKNVSD